MNPKTRLVLGVGVALIALGTPTDGRAQEDESPWSVRVQAVLSGTSHHSEPIGYKIYSGVALGVSLARTLSDHFSLELSLRTESREVEGPDPSGATRPLGSLEMLPVSVLGRWQPWTLDRGFAPYVGVGLNTTATWEKSGVLDSSNVAPSLGPTLQFGSDFRLSSGTVLNFDVKWRTQVVEITDFVSPAPRIDIDPLEVALGLGFAF